MRTATEPTAIRGRGTTDVPVLLARWRSGELRLARTFRECGGVGDADIEELYDETVVALLSRRYGSEEHLRAALHKGIKLRALRLHRDRTAHHRALAHAAPVIHAVEQARAFEQEPERALIAREDDMIVGEFLSDLTPLERKVFALMANERSWRAIGTTLGLAENDARNATRSCERKSERFVKLYESGRLCGWRSHTIKTLRSGEETGELALEQSLAHLSHCHTCQTQHQTTHEEMRTDFQGRALAVLPMPVLMGAHVRLLDRIRDISEYAIRLAERLAGPGPGTGMRERLVEAAAGAAGATKIAVGVIGAAALAGGALSATHVLDAPRHTVHAAAPQSVTESTGTLASVNPLLDTFRAPLRSARAARRSAYRAGSGFPFGPGHVVSAPRRAPPPPAAAAGPATQRAPGGFAYLGVPAAPRPPAAARPMQPAGGQVGGAFSP